MWSEGSNTGLSSSKPQNGSEVEAASLHAGSLQSHRERGGGGEGGRGGGGEGGREGGEPTLSISLLKVPNTSLLLESVI